MLKSEKKSLIRFLLIYLGSTFLLFSLASWIFYNSQRHHIFDQQRDTLKIQAGKVQQELRVLHKSFGAKLVYPTHPTIESSIYDKDRKYIFGSMTKGILLDPKAYTEDENRLYYFTKVEPHYLGASFLLLETSLDMKPIVELQNSIFLFLMGAGLFLLC